MSQSEDLYAKSLKYQEVHPKVRARELASMLGVTEAQLVAAGCDGGNTQLRCEYEAIFNDLSALGELLAITRNDAIVHEVHATYKDMKKRGNVGMFFEPSLDARFFFDRWFSVFAVNEKGRHSIQFFDQQGQSAHKIYMLKDTDINRYNELVKKYRDPDKTKEEINFPVTPLVAPGHVDEEAIKASWSAMGSVHEGGGIIHKFALGDYQSAYKALGIEYAVEVEKKAVEEFIKNSSNVNQSMRIFVMNGASVQSYAGIMSECFISGPWFNILKKKFNLHLKTQALGHVWLVKKPVKNGIAVSMSILSQEGKEIMVISDSRSKVLGQSELWLGFVESLINKFQLK